MARKGLDKLSTARLEAMLEAELNREGADVESIRQSTAALDERTNKNSADTAEKWTDFTENYAQSEPLYGMPPEKKMKSPRRMLIRIAIAAAVLVMMTFAVGTAADLGGPTILWSVGSYRFDYANIVGKITAPYLDDVPGVDEMARRLTPEIVPEGFTAEEYFTDDSYTAVYSDGERQITVMAEKIDGMGEIYQWDNTIPEEYASGGLTRYISVSGGKWFAAWTEEGYGCVITGAESRDEIIEIIDSLPVNVE